MANHIWIFAPEKLPFQASAPGHWRAKIPKIRPPNTIIQQPEIRSQIDFLLFRIFFPSTKKHVNWPLGSFDLSSNLSKLFKGRAFKKVLLPVHSKATLHWAESPVVPLLDLQNSARTALSIWANFDSHGHADSMPQKVCHADPYATNQPNCKQRPSRTHKSRSSFLIQGGRAEVWTDAVGDFYFDFLELFLNIWIFGEKFRTICKADPVHRHIGERLCVLGKAIVALKVLAYWEIQSCRDCFVSLKLRPLLRCFASELLAKTLSGNLAARFHWRKRVKRVKKNISDHVTYTTSPVSLKNFTFQTCAFK